MNNKTNKDLPASAVMPFNDQFGQTILLTGFTKHESVALEIFKHLMREEKIKNVESSEDVAHIIKSAYFIAEHFLNYATELEDKNSVIMPI